MRSVDEENACRLDMHESRKSTSAAYALGMYIGKMASVAYASGRHMYIDCI